MMGRIIVNESLQSLPSLLSPLMTHPEKPIAMTTNNDIPSSRYKLLIKNNLTKQNKLLHLASESSPSSPLVKTRSLNHILKQKRPTMTTDTLSLLLTKTLCLVLIPGVARLALSQADSECGEPLLSQARLSASSEQNRDRGASAAFLNTPSSAWTASQSDFAQYLTIDLGNKFNVTSIASQGRAHSNEYVMEYRIDFGYDGQDFAPYRDRNGNIKIFEANGDDSSVAENRFESPLVAQYIRINPTNWHNRISMRIEVYGCHYTAEVLSFDGQSILGMNLRRRTVNSIQGRTQFRFKTPNANANLLYATGEEGDLMAMQLINNKLVFSVDLGATGNIQNLSAGSLLDDNTWHDVSIDYHGKEIILSVDRVVIKKKLSGDFVRLNLDLDLWIGGLPGAYSFAYNSIGMRNNFTGCIENLMINTTNVATEWAEDSNHYIYNDFGNVYRHCHLSPTQSISFMTNESYFKVEGYQLHVMNVSLDFRTFVENGVLLYSKFSVGGLFTISLKDGKLITSLQGEFGPQVEIEPSEAQLNDGSWHSVRLVAKENQIDIQIDDNWSLTKRRIRFESGREYYLGGAPDGRPGLIGCMRNVYIEGRYLTLSSIPAEKMFRTQAKDILLQACQMIDRCHPNPCKHNGICKQTNQEFTCDCSKTGYLGAVCHVSKHPPTCEAYRIDNPKEREKDIYLDVDGSGPLGPVSVRCKFIQKGPTQTILHHRSENEILVKGYEGKGTYVRSIDYYAPWESIRSIVERSNSCSQHIKYNCINSQLFNSGINKDNFDPYSWWVGSNNQKTDFWGGSIPGSGMCACGLDGSCKDPTKSCNCDAIMAYSNTELSDEGFITQKDFLPVRELHIGDTGPAQTKQARVNLGPLICEGDTLFNEAITFRKEDATISLPNLFLGEAIDIYIQFKTTISSAVLMHGRGLNEEFKLSIIGDKQIQFSSSIGADMQPLTAVAPYRLNDNDWHSILIERNKKEIRLVVDGQITTSTPIRINSIRTTSSPTTHLSLGATDDFRDGFVGCVRSLLINGQPIDMYKHAAKGAYGIILGCHGKCETNPCLNKGRCKEAYSSFVCDCQWTAFKGPICGDEIGANFRSENYVRYDFDSSSLSTVEENIRVGFTTTEHKGLILGITSHTGEYMNLLMSTSGQLKLEFDFGFERKEEVIGNDNFALGQHHDIIVKRTQEGSKLIVIADNYEPKVYQYKIGEGADTKFDQLKSIYIGRNETMHSGDGFVGCISHVSFDDHYPLRFLFQESRKSNVHAFPPDDSIMEDSCGIEPIRPPPEMKEVRPPASVREQPGSRAHIMVFGFLYLILAAILALATFTFYYIRWRSNEKGDYITNEDSGAKQALDPDTAVMMGVTGATISKKQEYFI